MQSKATTVEQYLAELPADRREALQAVRRVVLANIDKKGYRECMGYGMMGYAVPHSVYPPGYHCDPSQPLPFVGMASQKQHMSFYMMCLYGNTGMERWFRDAWAKTGKKLDMGKCCIRFKRVEDLALDVIGEAIRRMPAEKYIALYESAIKGARRAKTAPKPKPKAKAKGAVKARRQPASAARRGGKAAGRTARAPRRA
ncbi:MAG: DUF1801 domain-containing protein, partial [Phycisphaeraceae bacterium]|nr:DUF1801 domain-containing protein [Phycisphaeraceae bacterium]